MLKPMVQKIDTERMIKVAKCEQLMNLGKEYA